MRRVCRNESLFGRSGLESKLSVYGGNKWKARSLEV
jgi:hypothetical protein